MRERSEIQRLSIRDKYMFRKCSSETTRDNLFSSAVDRMQGLVYIILVCAFPQRTHKTIYSCRYTDKSSETKCCNL